MVNKPALLTRTPLVEDNSAPSSTRIVPEFERFLTIPIPPRNLAHPCVALLASVVLLTAQDPVPAIFTRFVVPNSPRPLIAMPPPTLRPSTTPIPPLKIAQPVVEFAEA